MAVSAEFLKRVMPILASQSGISQQNQPMAQMAMNSYLKQQAAGAEQPSVAGPPAPPEAPQGPAMTLAPPPQANTPMQMGAPAPGPPPQAAPPPPAAPMPGALPNDDFWQQQMRNYYAR